MRTIIIKGMSDDKKIIDENKPIEAICVDENRPRSEFERALEVLNNRQGSNIKGVLTRSEDGNNHVKSVTIEEIRQKPENSEQAMQLPASGGVKKALELAEINPAYLANVLKAGLNARRPTVIQGKIKRLPDHAVRIKYLELAHKLRGDLDKNKGDDGPMSYEQRIKVIMERNSNGAG
jgi:hypothetical protein